jgi:MFS family permease
VVLHLSASESGMALIPLMGSVVTSSVLTGRGMVRLERYKRMPLIGCPMAIVALCVLAIWPDSMPLPLVLVLQMVVGLGLGSVFPISTVCLQNAVSRAQMGIATGAANFFRALFSSLVVAILGAIVLGGLGGGTGVSIDMLARSASSHELAYAFRLVFLACALILTFGLCFIIAMEERPLRGPTPPSGGATAPQAPATPIPA